MMTNTATALRSDRSTTDRRATSSASDAPPTRPPPPIRARARGMVRPVTRRRAPAVPPPSTPPVGDDDVFQFVDGDVFELDPVLQNERNDEIWQRRMGVGVGRATGAPDSRRALRPRRRSSSQSAAAASHGPCRQCRHVEETGRLDAHRATCHDFITLKPVTSCAVNEYVDEPSTDAVHTSSSSIPLRLSDLSVPPLKSAAKDTPAAGSSTSLRAAVAAHELGVTCGDCGGCRCAPCRRAPVVPCACLSADDVRCRCDRRRAVRTVLGVCVPCLYVVSACRRHCTNAPHVCRCRVDPL